MHRAKHVVCTVAVLALAACGPEPDNQAKVARRIRSLRVRQWHYTPDEYERLSLAADLAEQGRLEGSPFLVSGTLQVEEPQGTRNLLSVRAFGEGDDIKGIRLIFRPPGAAVASFLDVPLTESVYPDSPQFDGAELRLLYIVTFDETADLRLEPHSNPSLPLVVVIPSKVNELFRTMRVQVYSNSGGFTREARLRVQEPHEGWEAQDRRMDQPINHKSGGD